ncbi:MAG: hypothetical protein ACK58T_38155 [Phycisphaerae bacterium]
MFTLRPLQLRTVLALTRKRHVRKCRAAALSLATTEPTKLAAVLHVRASRTLPNNSAVMTRARATMPLTTLAASRTLPASLTLPITLRPSPFALTRPDGLRHPRTATR